MDTVRFGRQIRALRRRRGWRQVDLSLAADMSRASLSRIERGHADQTTLAALDAVARALSARLEVGLSWNWEGLDRLLDAYHAAIVEVVARELRALEWDVAVEVTFNIRGERGSIDILAFHPATGVILVVEVKSVVPTSRRLSSRSIANRGSRSRSRGLADGAGSRWVGSSSWPTAEPRADGLPRTRRRSLRRFLRAALP
jgi:transcriptional regulator with XRE-family HTH domain